jgi:hypothetical protein
VGPGRGLSVKPAKPSRANRPRHRLTVRGIVPTVRAIDRVERPSAASKTIRARSTSRCSVVDARNRASSTARSSGESRTSAASGIIPMLNHDSAFRDSGDSRKTSSWAPGGSRPRPPAGTCGTCANRGCTPKKVKGRGSWLRATYDRLPTKRLSLRGRDVGLTPTICRRDV